MDYHKFLFEEFPNRINDINSDLERKWGIMTPQHLVEHLSLLFYISSGKLTPPGFFPAEKQAKRKEIFFSKYAPFPKSFSPTGEATLFNLRFESLDAAKDKLLQSFHAFKESFESSNKMTNFHPVFGDLNYEEWVEFHARHIKHHFEQFGLS